MSDTYFDIPSRIEDAFPEIESDITMGLMETNDEYAALNDEISDWKKKHPFIDKVMEGSGEIHLTSEEHKALAKYLSIHHSEFPAGIGEERVAENPLSRSPA